MAFYTATWFKQLVREDHVNIQKYLNKKGNDLRGYIDSTLPFTLWLDISNIRKNILKPEARAIQELCASIKIQDPNIFINALDDAYVATINEYIETYPHINSKDLAAKLDAFSLAIDTGGIKNSIQTLFKRTTVISELSKKNKSVLLIAPKFTTIQSDFGPRVKSHFNYDLFSDLVDDELGNSPKNLVKAYLNKNFGVLQNIGHIEIDVLSSKSGSSEVKRGLVSPRLLQALLEWPKDAKPELLARKFSKETGQAETRVIIRKRFSNSKLVLEMLIESGLMIGSLESQEENLKKARDERAFKIGSALSRRLVEDKDLLLNLVTSKSIKQYVTESLFTAVKSGKSAPSYQSNSALTQKTPISVQKSDLVVKAKNTNTSKLSVPIPKQISSENFLINLQSLLNSQLQDVISANMGDGNSRNILNYRTGRFASTVKVEKISSSRQGMITAFYSYMKNPYATFSDGGKQSIPKSRDPKLLISKSIREIAGQVVTNRLRAVAL
jgi:hypothetical protein